MTRSVEGRAPSCTEITGVWRVFPLNCPLMKRRATSIIKIAMVLVVMLFLLCIDYQVFRTSPGMDFDHYYVGAQMVRRGQGASLYDPSAQKAWQLRILGRHGPLFNYPAFVALLYWPTALCDLNHGYLLWATLTMAAFALSLYILNRSFCITEYYWWLLLLTQLYVPLQATILSGQSDAFILLAYSLAFAALKSENPRVAGLALALGLIKFHLVLPFVLVMLLRKQWSLVCAFLLGAAALIGVSLAIAGPGSVLAYPRLLRVMQSLPYGGFHPAMMPNLRGVVFLTTGREAPLWLLAASAIAALCWVARRWSSLETGFSAALGVTLVTNYHAYVPDLLLLVIPLGVLMKSPCRSAATRIVVLGSLAIPVIPYLSTMWRCSSLLSLPIALMCVTLIFFSNCPSVPCPRDTSGQLDSIHQNASV